MNHFEGTPITVNDAACAGQPRMRLAPQGIGPGMVYVSAAVRQMMDAWMLERFGKEVDKIYRIKDPLTGQMTLVVSTAILRRLEAK